MTFILHRQVGKGTALNDIRASVLRIGRGTNAELRSENPAVALEHALIEEHEDGYYLIDRGSITGTYLNGKPIESSRLSKGDHFEIGDLRVDVQIAEKGKPLFLKVRPLVAEKVKKAAARPSAETAAPAPVIEEEGQGQLKASKIDYVAAYQLRRPYLSKALVAVLAVVLASFALIALLREKREVAFMPGGVSSAHARVVDDKGRSIGTQCEACHDPWAGVVDRRCETCHAIVAHAETQTSTPPCISCHSEHRDFASLASVVSDQRCTECHADLASNTAGGNPMYSKRTTSFGEDHAEFSLAVKREGSVQRVSVTSPAALMSDTNSLRFNHQYHLKKGGVLTATGAREELTCESCHKMVQTGGKADPAPISFASNCQRCHQLTFDARFPDSQVPHGGEPGVVYGFVMAAYGGNREIVGKNPEEMRRLLSARSRESSTDRAFFNAEQVIKTKCTLCHELGRREGKLAVTPPVIPQQWFKHASFSHTPHLSMSCETCHGATRTSHQTSDVLMPGRVACTGCHGGASTTALTGEGISSNCTTCHDYHERSKNVLRRIPGVGLPPQRVELPVKKGS